MLDDFCSTLDCWPRALRHRIHDEHVVFSELSRVVFRCAEAGDLPAMRVIAKEARELVLMASTVIKRLKMVCPRIALVGSCFEAPVFRKVFVTCSRDDLPDASISVSDKPIAEGAAILAQIEAMKPLPPLTDEETDSKHVTDPSGLPTPETAGTI